jgi:hypothetical protein
MPLLPPSSARVVHDRACNGRRRPVPPSAPPAGGMSLCFVLPDRRPDSYAQAQSVQRSQTEGDRAEPLQADSAASNSRPPPLPVCCCSSAQAGARCCTLTVRASASVAACCGPRSATPAAGSSTTPRSHSRCQQQPAAAQHSATHSRQQSAHASSPVCSSFSFAHHQFLTPWLTVTDGKSSFLQSLTFSFTSHHDVITAFAFRASYAQQPGRGGEEDASILVQYDWEEAAEMSDSGVWSMIVLWLTAAWAAVALAAALWWTGAGGAGGAAAAISSLISSSGRGRHAKGV